MEWRLYVPDRSMGKKNYFCLMGLSFTEENYLKTIFTIAGRRPDRVSNQAIAIKLNINPASVTDMLRKLDEKKMIIYSRSSGATLTREGKKVASKVLRKHRLWETFLVNKMHFSWSEVHEVAEQLEHIQSDKLLDQLDKFLGFPKFDPHGDPIPDAQSKILAVNGKPLSEMSAGKAAKVVNVIENDPAFLTYLDKLGIGLKVVLAVKEVQPVDKSLRIAIKGKKEIFLSREVAQKILVE